MKAMIPRHSIAINNATSIAMAAEAVTVLPARPVVVTPDMEPKIREAVK